MDGLAPPYRAGLPRQHPERRLKSVLRVMDVAEHAPANAPNEWSMSPNKLGEGALVSPSRKQFQKLPIRQLRA